MSSTLVLLASLLLIAPDAPEKAQPTVQAAPLVLAETGAIDWEPIFRGVDHARLTLTEPRPLVVNAVRVDLDAEGVDFFATPGNGERPEETDSQSTADFLAEHGLRVAINTHFFSPCCSEEAGEPKDLKGWSVSEGEQVSPRSEDTRSGDAFLYSERFGPAAAIMTAEQMSLADIVPPEVVVAGGVLYTPSESVTWAADDKFAQTRHPRSAIGVSDMGKTVVLVTVDGRQKGYSEGASLEQLATIMRRLGCDAAMNVDGGGSTTLVMQGADGNPELLNKPSGGKARVVASSLGVRAEGLDRGE